MKGLPLAYSKDMQEDKEGAFDGLRTLSLCLAAMTGMVARPDARPRAHEGGGGRRLRDRHRSRRLAGARRWTCRSARRITSPAASSRSASAKGVALEKLSLAEMQSVEPRITADAFEVLGVENSVRSRTSYGGTAPDNVRAQAEGWLKRLQGS